MEEYDDVLLKSLQNAGVSIPSNVASVQDLTPATLVSICAQSLNLLDETASLPSSFPDSWSINSRSFLYPSEEDLFKLVRFLVERLSESSVDVKFPDLKDANSRRKIKEEGSTDNLEDWMEKADDRGLDLNHNQEKFKDLSLHNVESELSDSKVEDTSFSGLRTTNFGKDKLAFVGIGNLLAAEGNSGRDAFQKANPARDQSSKVYTCIHVVTLGYYMAVQSKGN
ncbi:hypothetical protein GH714_022854 [Hevea brasiliensis]|uniref:CCDC22 N-terminal domain-containing protein n=1 Tax=Hevea brasiliensis TaxID=3981 RepID=A0A6A6KJF9_HEVBR|nr:hypothetical protein GH714_022854 [Hevea brasiliensis]